GLRRRTGRARHGTRTDAALLQSVAMSAVAPPLVELRGVSKRFTRRLDFAGKLARKLGARVSEATVHAVDDVSIAVREREVVGLVGESGCGKSTLGRIVSRVIEPSDGERLW